MQHEKNKLKTLSEAKAWFIEQGISIADWSRDHGFNQFTVYRILDGTLKCRRGISHRIAVELGLKEEISHKKNGPRTVVIRIQAPNELVDVESIRKELASILDRSEPSK